MPTPLTSLPLDKIHFNEQNPRILKDERFKQLVQSLEEFPEMLRLRPHVVDEAGVVLGGNMRLRAKCHLSAYPAKRKAKRTEQLVEARAEKLGLAPDAAELLPYRALLAELFDSDEVPVTQALGLTEAQKREFILKDNASFGEWDWDALANGEWGDAATLNSWGLDIPKDWDSQPEILDEVSLPEGDAPEFATMTFRLTQEQAKDVNIALGLAQRQEGYDVETGNDNKNGNALAYLCQLYNSQHNSDDDANSDPF